MDSPNKELSLFDETGEISKNSLFLDRKIVIEGMFHSIKKETLKSKIKRLGGEIVSGDVTKNINYFVIGDNVSSEKMEKYDKLCFNGYKIKTLSESDILNIFNGEVEQYIVPSENPKLLHLTIEHYNKKHVCYSGKITESSGREFIPNPLYGKNIYLGQCITGNKMILRQMLGLVGVFCGLGLSDATQVIVLSHSAYIALKNGIEHPEITLIQEIYNHGLAQWYGYLLTTEEDLLTWYKSRFELCNDSVCKKLYENFIDSKN